jgi:chemosensory pili system protein ChpA (sensor histidine kinase/response regulator)
MADNRNFAALDWLIHEIGETLKEARQSLEAYVENPKDAVRIRFCLTHIHQVHGSLQMVEFYGAAMLADEMEQLTQAMINNAVTNSAEAQEVLMRAILQFPLYLEQVKNTRKDNPLVVLPLLNDLRAVRGENLLTDTKLFVPNLAPAKRISGERMHTAQDNVQFQAMALKLRQMYQYAAAGFIRGVNPEENLTYLQKVFMRLYKLTQGTARQPLWDICLALAEALQMDALEISVSVKNLLRQLDREIKLLVVHGTKALNSYTKDDLIKNLLYYVARSGKHASGFAPDSHLQRIYVNYQLEQALLEGKETSSDATNNILSAPDPDAMRSVVSALKDELDIIKHALDVCLSGGDSQHVLTDALPVIKRVADTMAVLGIGELRKQVLEQGAVLEMVVDAHSELSQDQLMSVAGKVIEIENALDSLIETSSSASSGDEADINLSRAKESVLRESRNGLEHAKDSIIEYIASQWDRVHLQSVPNTLREIRGGLDIMPLPRPARILGACARYIEEQLLTQETTPQWTSLDTLADAITSVEYYLERLSSGAPKEENDLLLRVAEESVASLGYAVAKTPRADIDSASDLPSLDSTAENLTGDTEPADEDTTALLAAYESALDANAQPTNATADIEQSAVLTPVEVTPTPAHSIAAAANNASATDDDDEIDHEIIEIFVEEAGEVLATIAEYFPLWAKNFADEDSLTHFRRAFHTLKGSGRMVGATELGELAWSIENMLNRIIDQTIEAGAPHIDIIEKVRHLLPGMVTAFHHQQPNPEPQLTEQYRTQAESLSKGKVPAETTSAEVAVDETITAEIADDKNIETADIQTRHEQSSWLVTAQESEPDEYADKLAAELASAYQQVTHDIATADTEDDDDLADEGDGQLWDIFSTEAVSHLQVVNDYIERMEEVAPFYEPPSEHIQRALHTLKGSAHMADITPVAELATPLEKFVKELRSYHININEDILQLLRDAASYTHFALDSIDSKEPIEIPRLQQFLARVNELRELHVAPLVRQQEADVHGKRPVDPELLAIFMAEEMNLLLNADQIIASWQATPNDLQPLQPLLDELRNLTYGAAHAYLPPMAELGEKLQQVYRAVIAHQLTASEQICETLNRAHLALLDMVDAVAAGQNLDPIPEDIHDSLNALLATAAHTIATEAEDSVESETESDIELTLPEDDTWQPVIRSESATEADDIEDYLANDAYNIDEINADEPLSAELDIETETPQEEDNPELEVIAFEAIDIDGDDELLSATVEIEAVDITLPEEDGWQEVAEEEEAIFYSTAADSAPPGEQIDIDDGQLEAEQFNEEMGESASIHDVVEEQKAKVSLDEENEDYDPEIVEIFIEEAGELLEDIERALHEWQDDWNNTDCVEDLKRSLHTFKGGARLAGLADIGDLSHEFESELIEMGSDADIDQNFFRRMNTYQDNLHALVDRARAHMNGDTTNAAASDAPADFIPAPNIPTSTLGSSTFDAMPVANEHSNESAGNDPAPDTGHHAFEKANVLPFAPKAKPQPTPSSGGLPQPSTDSPGMRAIAPGGALAPVQHLAARRAGPQEVVKVSADLLEELVNLAGETSISRGRMEQQVSDLGLSIEEMDSTILRLQEQLRRLDIETEAQVLFRQEQMAQHEGFDPLEMDRYSQLQQLSRSLIESASDLMDLKFTLADKTRDTETLLLQQSRINTDLQEGLMRSRMVPFSRLVPRLRRIVRQAATELGKEVDFELDNVEGELDRSVLERMVAPLEHMLRNAVDHGIEMPAERVKTGKAEAGRIVLSLGREGGDVMLRLTDDGRGINLQRVREKAIERGLMTADAQLSDQDVIQFILHAGFSTADKVTQISGRGVGMDVVHSEIKQLGGSMFIDSNWGEGTEFIVRLPFTVSVNRALMVQIGDDLYAIPLNTIEGIVRVSPFELEHYYQDDQARFEYAGENYLVRYLGTMLDSDAHPKLDGQSLPLPVVLVRSAENTVALQVDRLLGSREIVVKTLGAQFSAVRGVSGATVMGDGSVVVILDLHAMLREQLALGFGTSLLLDPFRVNAANDEDQVEKLVMVVDDSVTVRKVTSRFLEREGFNVITAKDGVEALQLLQDHMPDVMLLDIEMPRMDGFEVAKNIRTSSRLKDIPIIMITSRTGEKHRDHAFSLGVNKYLGKPYQEDLLLSSIRELLGRTVN